MTTWEGRNGVKPHVLRSGEIIAAQFLVPRVLGIGIRSSGTSDHPRGLALDFMVGLETGNRIRIYLVDPGNWKLHNVKYVIHNRKIYNRPVIGGYLGEPYVGASPHTDHVHVSYTDSGAPPGDAGRTWGDMNDPAPGLSAAVDSAAETLGIVKQIYAALQQLGKAFAFVTEPNNWWRIALFFLGVVALGIGMVKLDKSGTAQQVASTAVKVVK